MFITGIEMRGQIQKLSRKKTCQVSVIVQMCVRVGHMGLQFPRKRAGLRRCVKS